jgi:hypothetical protein
MGLDREELAADERREMGREVGLVLAGRGGERGDRERLADDGRRLEQGAVRRVEGVEPRGDERVEACGDGERSEVARRAIGAVGQLEAALGDESPDGLDRVERDAVGPLEDRPCRGLGEAGDEPLEEAAHRLGVERLERQRREGAGRRTPPGSPLQQLGASQRHDEDRRAVGPGEEMLDEVQEPAVGPLEVLEQQDRRPLLGDPLEEDPPGREEAIAATGRRRLEAEQRQQGRFHPAAVLLVRDVLGHRGGDASARRRLVVGLGQAGPPADHLAKRPERDPLPVRRGAAAVPPDRLRDAVGPLLELPGEAALADAGRAGDRDEPGAAIAPHGRQGVPQEAEILVAADERRLREVGAPAAAPLGHDPQRPPGRHGRGPPF